MITTTKSSNASARPRDGQGTRKAVIAAAMRLIHVHGYNAMALDDVLRESGVGKGNFYYHFKSKEDLGHAILDQIVDGFLERTLAPCFADPDGAPLGQIRCFLDRVLEAQRERNCVGGCVIGNLASELSDVHEGFRTRLATLFTAWQARLAAALESARRRGELVRGSDPETMARFVIASLEGAILLAKVSKDIRVMEQCVGELKRYLALHEVRS
jgi:TetR/AcrR family transcriptional regulator, transcriptional repressor for nem operon